jgi:methyl-accepting chemotaxis protein
MLGFRNWPIAFKIMTVVAIFIVGFVLFALQANQTIEEAKVKGPHYNYIVMIMDLRADILPPPEYIVEAYLTTLRMEQEKDPAKLDEHIAKLKDLHNQYDVRHAYWIDTLKDNPDSTLKDEYLKRSYEPAADFYKIVEGQFIPAILAGDRAKAVRLSRGVMQQKYELHKTAIDNVVKLSDTKIAEGEKRAADIIRQGTMTLLGGGILAVLLATAVSLLIARAITAPLQNVVAASERIAQGDLSGASLEAKSTDEVGRLSWAFNRMVESLRGMAGQTLGVTQALGSATSQILASTQHQAASTGEQAAAVHETTATMEEISRSGGQIAEKAQQVAAQAEATSAASQQGMSAIQTTTRSMDAIQEQAEAVAENIVALSEKTQAVGEIIATVNDIAEQSNLLALNAAIEAAAAGEQGRSFSVVANEMKNLADQSKEATVQVRSILGDIQKGINTSVMLTEEAVKRVESGKQQVAIAEDTIRQMAESILESIQAFQQIVAATSQQQIGFEQVTQAVQDIRQATEQTVSGTRQLEEAAASLSQLGGELRSVVEVYRV